MFITEEYLKQNSTLDINIETKILRSAINDAQEIHIQQLLGRELYLYIQTNQETLSGLYKVLFDDYIKPSLKQYALFEILPFLSYKQKNIGVVQQNSPYSQNTELNTLKYLRESALNKAEFLGQRMVDYLVENKGNISEYTNYTQKLKPNSSSYNCAIFLD